MINDFYFSSVYSNSQNIPERDNCTEVPKRKRLISYFYQMNEGFKILQEKGTIQFINDNLFADTNQLLLNPPSEYRRHISLIVDQILSRRKAKNKLPEWYANPNLIMPPPLSLEQCSSKSTAEYKKQFLSGKHLIDLTGGMGIDSLALSENYNQTTYVEQFDWLCEVFDHNSKILGKNLKVVNSSAEEVLKALDGKADFFIDPARRNEHKKQVFHFENCSPNLIELLPLFERKAEKVLVKAAPMIDISLGIEQLKSVSAVHVVSVKNEVKEVLFLLDYQVKNEPTITCANLETNQPEFSFKQSQEKMRSAKIAPVEKYIYDPNASILKAGAFKSIANSYELIKLGVNTHLYTSEKLIRNFPGRVFEVIKSDCTKKDIAQLIPSGKANVITKNYPMKPEELKKKFKLKDGGDWFLIGYRNDKNKAKMCVIKQVF